MDITCTNCGNQINLDFSFCPHCSQKTNLHRLSMHEVIHDGIHYFTHADKGFFHLIKTLCTKTGNVPREFINGKRKKYFPPLNFFLLVAAIFVFLINLMSSTQHTDILKQHPELSKIENSAEREKFYQMYKRQGDAVGFINKYSNVMSMIALPLITLIFWLSYLRGNYNYTEHLVAGMYMTGFLNLVYILIFVPISLWAVTGYSLTIFGIFVVFQVIYSSIFYYRFINKRTTGALLKAIGVSIFAILFWTGLSSFLVGLYIATGFWGLINLTIPKAFIRFVGNNLHPTDYTRIVEWAKRIKIWLDKGLQEVYFFMHHTDEKNSPALCDYAIEQINKHCGTQLRRLNS